MKRTVVAACTLLLWACTDEGPRGADAARGYAVAASYVLEFRRHFFLDQANQICIAEKGWPGHAIARGLRTYHLPVQVACGTDPDLSDESSGAGLRVVLGPGPNPIRWAPIFDNPEWAHTDDVRAEVRYSDSVGHDAVFSCKLYRSASGWQVEACDLLSVREPGDRPPTSEDLAGCWSLQWIPITRSLPFTLPSTAALTLEPDSVDSVLDGLLMTEVDHTRLQDDWGLGWRWALRGPYLVDLMGGGIFEGIHVQLVWDRESDVLRGVGSHWTDSVALPELPDPDWRVVGSRRSCASLAERPSAHGG